MRLAVAALGAALVLLSPTALPLAGNAQPVRAHTVKQILLDGKDVPSATGVGITPPGGAARSTVARGETIVDGTRVDVGAHAVVVIVSTGEKSTVTLEPGASITFVSTGSGEVIRSNGGKALFDVVHNALDFFRVQYGDQITAGVSGTAFSIDSTDKTVTFACTTDEVLITKSGYLRIGGGLHEISLIDVISPASTATVTYAPTANWNLGKFANFAEAEQFYQQQLVSAQKSGDQNAVAGALRNIGKAERPQGRETEALQAEQQALAIYRQLTNREGEARTLSSIGDLERLRQRYAEAMNAYQPALAIFRDLGDRGGEADVLNGIGFVQAFQGRYDAALKSQNEALAIYRQLGNRDGEAAAWQGMGVAYVEPGQGHTKGSNVAGGNKWNALGAYQKALELYLDMNDRFHASRTLRLIGRVYEHQGDASAALESYHQALALSRELDDSVSEDQLLDDIARVEAGAPAKGSQGRRRSTRGEQ